MADEIQKKIDELSTQLEQQRQLIANLETSTILNSSNNCSALPVNPLGIATVARYDASRVPDAIKLITPFGGGLKLLPNWIESIKSKLNFAKQLCPTPDDEVNATPMWHSIVRDKVIDKANEALIQNHTLAKWSEFRKTLKEYFGDKRPWSLKFHIFNKVQKTSTISTMSVANCVSTS